MNALGSKLSLRFISVMILLVLFFSVPGEASAHAFGSSYNLPIPFWLYSYAAAGALLVSFLIIGFFFKETKRTDRSLQIELTKYSLIRLLVSPGAQIIYKTISVGLLLLTIVSGLIGEDISAFNFNMTFFWIIFVLGFTYLTFLLGDIWEVVNPWRIISEMVAVLQKKKVSGILEYPDSAGYYPAFIFYIFFIIIELFLGTTPFSLSVILLQYSCITLFAAYLFGIKWFTYGEFFSVFFRFISYASPFVAEKKKIFFRVPFSGLLDKRATDMSMLLFILFMLSSTAFDGFRETNAWAQFYWSLVSGSLRIDIQLGLLFVLILSPLIFLFLYIIGIFFMKKFVATNLSLKELLFAFAFSLIPIALVYNLAHYFTLLLIQGQNMFRLLSDPFGWGWDLFGTVMFLPNPGVINAAAVWHFQVAFILIGHIISVFVAHLVALRIFPNHRSALRSQIPMLLLMIAYTIIGLWILSQPLALG